MTEVEIVLDSVNAETGDRITTIRAVYPRIVHSEAVTHRILYIDDSHELRQMLDAYDADIPSPLSRNAASSRAVPVNKMIQRVKDNPFVPSFRHHRKGMDSGDPVPPETQESALVWWQHCMDTALGCARELADLGIEKGLVNRLLEPFSHIEVLITATEWNNFLLLRDHPAAIVEIQELARAIRQAMAESKPQTLYPGEWHLPFVTGHADEWYTMQSAARCARVSYKSLATEQLSTYAEDMQLYDKLTASNPKHLSPTEHPARAESERGRRGNFVGWQSLRKVAFNGVEKGGDLRNE